LARRKAHLPLLRQQIEFAFGRFAQKRGHFPGPALKGSIIGQLMELGFETREVLGFLLEYDIRRAERGEMGMQDAGFGTADFGHHFLKPSERGFGFSRFTRNCMKGESRYVPTLISWECERFEKILLPELEDDGLFFDGRTRGGDESAIQYADG
jgi:hypothetical protein